MDTTASSFTARKNAKRAAEKMIANGKGRLSISALGPAMMGGLRSSGRPLRPCRSRNRDRHGDCG